MCDEAALGDHVVALWSTTTLGHLAGGSVIRFTGMRNR
jgi:hypothetical protein